MTQIWKRNGEAAEQSDPPLSESQDDILGRGFWRGGCEQLHEDPVTLALLGIGQQDARACGSSARWCAGGGILPLRKQRGLKLGHCNLLVSECGGHHHGSALGWGRRASLPSARPGAVLHGWMWRLDISSSIGVLSASSPAAPPALPPMACWRKQRQDQED